jgi:penicillin amidase
MRTLKFFLAVLFTSAVVFILNTRNPLGLEAPPLGKLLNPFTGFWQNAEPVCSSMPEQIVLEGLDDRVEVIFDERMVPHIFAGNKEDAFFAQGYLTAMNRLWQMDISVRSIGGRLSEVLGLVTLEVDRRHRRQGFLRAAENALNAWRRSPEEMALIDSYVAGVNAYIHSLAPADYPLEFKLLDYEPEAWTPLHTALFFKNMAETLCFRHEDLPATNALAVLDRELFNFLFPEYMRGQSPVIPSSVKWTFEPMPVAPKLPETLVGEVMPYRSLPQPPPFIGSNNWAVAGTKTASGHPILCNDPHLRLSLPSIWYELQIQTPEFNTYGVSLPGIPGIIIGFNEDIAWGVTNVGQDVLDWYALTWIDEAKTQYLLDDRVMDVEFVTDSIRVRGQKTPVIQRTKYTVWGPVVYESDDSPYQDLAMRWIAHDVPEEKPFYELGTFYQLMTGAGYADYDRALQGYDSPAQNFAFASREGDIAIRVNGRFPLKSEQQGRFIQDGSLSASAWQGSIPREQVPQVKNPARGFISSANQHSTDPSYPYYYNGSFDEYRGRYINQQLEKGQQLRVEDMKALQLDNYSLLAKEGRTAFLNLLDSLELQPEEAEIVETLRHWNGRFEKEAVEPVYFQALLDSTYRHTFDEFLLMADTVEMLFPDTWKFVEVLRTRPDHMLFDDPSTPVRERAADIVRRSLRELVASIQAGGRLHQKSWSELKDTRIMHLAGIEAFSSGYVPSGGYGQAPNAIKGRSGPSWRMIVELGPEVKAYGVYPGGQSGNPGSRFYDNMIEDWAKGNYYELFFMEDRRDRRHEVVHSLLMNHAK